MATQPEQKNEPSESLSRQECTVDPINMLSPQLLMHASSVRSCIAAFGAAVGLGRGVNATMDRLHPRELLSRLTRAGRDRL